MSKSLKLPRLVVFASGTKDGGGSGVRELLRSNITGILQADIVAVVSNHPNGGVAEIAKKYGIGFHFFKGPWNSDEYRSIVQQYNAEWVALSGWLKLVSGLDPRHTFNIHPGPLPKFGGTGMYGHYVHEAVIAAFKQGKIQNSAVSMHFVTEEYDEGPIFFQYPVLIEKDDTPETIATRVNKFEHAWQSYITNLVIHKKIYWDGKDSKSLYVPDLYWLHSIPTDVTKH